MTQRPELLAVDWGTTALRGALLAADGRVLAERAAPLGLLSVPPGGWAAVFEAEFGVWLAAHPGLVCLMAGMVGSRQGWSEAPYCACPAGPDDLARQLHWVRPGRVAIVPGLCTEADGIPDVLRGEEVQIVGALQDLQPGAGVGNALDATLVLPGSHSKWVTVRGGRITGFSTHLTGECYALLRQHSILARSLPADDGDWRPEAFDQGVALAQRPGGLLHHLFAVRTLALFGRQDGPALASLLSGLVIGEELRAQALPAGAAVQVVGSPLLTARYQRALAMLGLAGQAAGAEAGWRGLLAIAVRAGIAGASGPSSVHGRAGVTGASAATGSAPATGLRDPGTLPP